MGIAKFNTKKSIFILIFIILLSLFWSGLALMRVIQSHHELITALSTRGGFKSNIVDPKPYLYRASVKLLPSIAFFLVNPFRKERHLIYCKREFIVCRASHQGDEKGWYLEIPLEILKIKITPKPNLFELWFQKKPENSTHPEEKKQTSE
ncbi:hypothetical protein ACFL27_14905 [candidate division CSSED10-310 bacterium]|uniref:Uncharacterized protein n=1 Tax=candidate division CSSED10-310 bacterium TaxID=2855610 RepID=A0ABV6YZ79_UNCC1